MKYRIQTFTETHKEVRIVDVLDIVEVPIGMSEEDFNKLFTDHLPDGFTWSKYQDEYEAEFGFISLPAIIAQNGQHGFEMVPHWSDDHI